MMVFFQAEQGKNIILANIQSAVFIELLLLTYYLFTQINSNHLIFLCGKHVNTRCVISGFVI